MRPGDIQQTPTLAEAANRAVDVVDPDGRTTASRTSCCASRTATSRSPDRRRSIEQEVAEAVGADRPRRHRPRGPDARRGRSPTSPSAATRSTTSARTSCGSPRAPSTTATRRDDVRGVARVRRASRSSRRAPRPGRRACARRPRRAARSPARAAPRSWPGRSRRSAGRRACRRRRGTRARAEAERRRGRRRPARRRALRLVERLGNGPVDGHDVDLGAALAQGVGQHVAALLGRARSSARRTSTPASASTRPSATTRARDHVGDRRRARAARPRCPGRSRRSVGPASARASRHELEQPPHAVGRGQARAGRRRRGGQLGVERLDPDRRRLDDARAQRAQPRRQRAGLRAGAGDRDRAAGERPGLQPRELERRRPRRRR